MNDKRNDNRAKFPELTKLIDFWRRWFHHAKLVHGVEGGREIGKRREGE